MYTITKLFPFLACLTISFSPAYAQQIQLINATSVPAISVAINNQLLYPSFPQGLYTADSATNETTITYNLTDLKSGQRHLISHNFSPHSRQALVFYGDFSPKKEPGKPNAASTANVHFYLLDYELTKTEKPLRYRIVNLIPNQPVALQNNTNSVPIQFAQHLTLNNQEATTTLTVQIGSQTIPILINQRHPFRNCDIILYPNLTGPTFIRFFEPNQN